MRNLVIHSHFYQPPREEPWLDLVPREPTAAPDHDWNSRITRQCYAPLTRGRVNDSEGRLVTLINTYAWCSFDVGPTLFRWFDRYAPDVRDAIIAADRHSVARLGAGNAMAMPYHHVILPLMSRRDKVTEVRWGIRDFRSRFNRDPAGMWLPETAVDEETMEVLADERIRFTVLAPSQVRRSPPFGRPGRWRGNGGREVAVFIYDGAASADVAFGDALADANRWHNRLDSLQSPTDGADGVIALATDGETFGHHHFGGDATLAQLIARVTDEAPAALTNFAALLDAMPVDHDVELVSPSSWSCPHGVDRWQRECGCRFDPATSQAWREPLRVGLVALKQQLDQAAQRDWPASAGDIWTARDVAGPDLLGAPQLDPQARRILELEEHALAMFTSCAWFFDDIGRLEPRIVLRHAARALELIPGPDRKRFERELVETLAVAVSNDPAKGTGADIWRRDVLPDAAGPARLAAGLAAVRDFAPALLDELTLPSHTWQLDGDDLVTTHVRTREATRWHVQTMTLGVVPLQADVITIPATVAHLVRIADYPWPIRAALRELAVPLIVDAALDASDRARVHDGLLDAEAIRTRALAGAWKLVRRDGLDSAAVVVHAALDLFDLDHAPIDEGDRAIALRMLESFPASPARTALALRFGIA